MLCINYKGEHIPVIRPAEMQAATFFKTVYVCGHHYDLWQEKFRMVAIGSYH